MEATEPAVLASNDGWTSLKLQGVSVPGGIAFDANITSRFWERGVELDRAELVDDAEATISAIALDPVAVAQLATDLMGWSSLPLKELASADFEVEHKLARGDGQELTLNFRATGAGRVQASVELAQEQLSVHAAFSTDATACAAFADGLRFQLAHAAL